MSKPTLEQANPWSYEDYWSGVLGAHRTAEEVVHEFELVADGLDEWLGNAESESWSFLQRGDLPAEWGPLHARALAELTEAASCSGCLGCRWAREVDSGWRCEVPGLNQLEELTTTSKRCPAYEEEP